jgi:hypothetical protein
MRYVVTSTFPLLYQIPEMRFVGSCLGFELANMSALFIVTGLAGSGRIFPSGLTALADRMYVI